MLPGIRMERASTLRFTKKRWSEISKRIKEDGYIEFRVYTGFGETASLKIIIEDDGD